MFVDAAFKEDILEFDTGYAIFYPSGSLMAAGGKSLNPLGLVLTAELEAIKLGMKYFFDNSITEFHIFSDSLDVVHAIRSRAEYLGIEEHIIDDLRIMIGNTSVKGICYTLCSNNKVAHKMAKFASKSPTLTLGLG